MSETEHNLNVGDLVETDDGVRLFVAMQNRDCDGTPLYSLTPIDGDFTQERPSFGNDKWVNGFPEESLTAVKRCPARHKSSNNTAGFYQDARFFSVSLMIVCAAATGGIYMKLDDNLAYVCFAVNLVLTCFSLGLALASFVPIVNGE